MSVDTTLVGNERSRGLELAAAIVPGASVGRYLVLRKLGQGGMGVVYAAFDPELDRKVALKVLHADLAARSADTSRLLREAQSLAKLSHPNVVSVHDVGTHGDSVFIAMEFIEGRTLREWLAGSVATGQPLGLRERLHLLVAAGRGIAAAHHAGIVHRDFKPDNVMVGRDGRVRVLDFGLALSTDAARSGHRAAPHSSLDPKRALEDGVELALAETASPRLTRTGALMGTPAYMAPEQYRGGIVDERSDQFAFCVAAYEAVYGERPFSAPSLGALAKEVLGGRVRPAPRGARVPRWLRKVLLRGLAVEPEARFADMDELLEQLERDPLRWRRRALALGAAVGLGVLANGLLDEPQLCRGAEAQLIGVWDEGTRDELAQTFAQVSPAYGVDAFAGIERRITPYAEAWVRMHTQSCEATRIRGEQSDEVLTLRMACLDRSLAQLSSLVEVYRSADAEVVARALEATEGLASLDACADVETLRALVRPPANAGERARVAELRGRIYVGHARELAGLSSEARTLLFPLRAEAEALGYRPLIAETELALAPTLDSPARQQDALERAIWMAEASRHDRVAAEAWIRLIEVRSVGLNDFAGGRAALARAQAALERIGGDVELRVRLDLAQGSALTSERELDQAIEYLRRAREVRVEGGQDDGALALEEVVRLSNALLDAGLEDDASMLLAQALDAARSEHGANHPWVAKLRASLARVEYQRRDFAAAEASLRGALAVFERANGPESLEVAGVRNGIALLLDEQRRFEEALPLYELALEVFERHSGPRHSNVAKVLQNIGLAQREMGELGAAISTLERSLAIRRELYGEDSEPVNLSSCELAGVLAAAGKTEGARETLAVLEQATRGPEVGQDDVRVCALTGLGELSHAEPLAARSWFEQAEQIVEQRGAQALDAALLAQHAFAYAKVLDELGERERALQLAQRSLAAYDGLQPYYAPHRESVASWLARRASASESGGSARR